VEQRRCFGGARGKEIIMRLRTIILILLTVLLGTGMGVFASLGDGIYSAICLFFYPVL